jgi:hypothetical protein
MNVARKVHVWFVSVLFLIVASPAAAQPGWSVSTGYQALHLPDTWAPAGINVDVAVDRTDAWSILGEFGVVHDGDDAGAVDPHDFNVYNVGGGARWSHRRAAIVPFVQLIGGIQMSRSDSDSDTAFMLQPGAGVYVPVGERWGVSAQGDYRPVFYREDMVNEIRFVLGVRWSPR